MFRIERRFVKVTGSRAVRVSNMLNDTVDDDEELRDYGDSELFDELEDETESGDRSEGKHAASSRSADKTPKEDKPSPEEVANLYITAAEREMKEKAEQVIREARDEAAAIIDTAHEDAEEERKRAYEAGFAEGEQAGKRVYDEKLAEQLRIDQEGLKTVLDEIARERERMEHDMEQAATALAIEIVRKIFNPAEEEVGNVYTSLIKNALRQMSTDGKFTIRVAPAQYEKYFSSGSAEIELDSGIVVKATVLKDVSFEDGDCIIDTENVTVNAGVESQLKFVQLAFERANQYEPE